MDASFEQMLVSVAVPGFRIGEGASRGQDLNGVGGWEAKN